MPEILVLSFPGEFALGGLFDSARSAEGRLAWFETLARTTMSPDEHAIVVVALEEGRPRAALPLVQTVNGLRALTAPYSTRYAPPLPDPAIAHELGLRAREYVPGVLRLDGIEEDEPGISAFLDGLSKSGLATAQYRGFANWYEPLTDFETWWDARPSRLKSTVRRKLSAASRAGATFRCLRDGFDEAYPLYDGIYGASWKDAEPHPKFMAAMVRSLGPEGLVRMGIMTIADRAVAAQIWLVCDRHATIFKLAHREDAAEFSPGTLLTHHMAATLIGEDRLEEIDFGRGDDAYKRDWTGQLRFRIGMIAGDWRKRAGVAAILKDVLPTRFASFVRGIGRQSPVNRPDAATIARYAALSQTPMRRITTIIGPGCGVGADR
jgi:hypothetical protein